MKIMDKDSLAEKELKRLEAFLIKENISLTIESSGLLIKIENKSYELLDLEELEYPYPSRDIPRESDFEHLVSLP